MDEREELAALRRLAELEAKAAGQVRPTFAETAGATIRDIPRQFGLTARYGLEAFGQTALPDLIGLPEPQNPNERVVGDMSRTAIGALGIAKGAQAATQFVNKAAHPVIAGITEALAANPGAQMTGAFGAGGAGGAVREAGGGPTEQFIAAVIGGVGGGLAYGPMAAAASGGKAGIQKLVAPKDIQGEVSVILQRTGINWKDLSREAQAQLVKDAERALYRGEPLDEQALARLAHYRNIGATPTRGAITQDPRQVTLEQNLAKSQANMDRPIGPDLSQIQNQNARTVLSTLDDTERSPLDAYAAGQRVQGNITEKDAAMKAAEDALYRQARDSAGRDIPLDRGAFVEKAWSNLEKNNRAPWLPSQVRDVLNTLSKGEGQFTVDTIDQLKTLLAQESRATTNGNTKAAIAAVRNALEEVQPVVRRNATGSTLPVTGAQGARLAAADQAGDTLTADTLGKFDSARAQARQRRTWQESAGFIDDALNGQDPAQFTKRHIINAPVDELTKLRKEIGRDAEAVAGVRKQLIGYIMERGRGDSDVVRFTSAGMEAGFNQIGKRKLALFFSSDEIQKIESAIKVAKYQQAQPIGAAVNNSNTGAMLVGRLLNSILNASTAAPVLGPMIAAPITGARVGLQARSAANVQNALTAPLPSPTGVPISPLLALALAPRGDQ